uniref:Putative reverse transcriptase-rnase h-integrase n=1 Tax=Moniliophthora roreri TaxID=221103 RepID=A0A0W0G5G3_MONRR
MILGLPWLRYHNPRIDWETGEIQFPPRRKIQIKRFRGILDNTESEVLIGAKITASQEMAHQQQTVKKDIDELIPKYLLGYRDRFEKGKAEQFPPTQTYDHAIDLKPDFVLRNCKLYLLSPAEQAEQDKFLEENLWKGYIRKSKSPMASPFFFVAKKEKGALRPTQDYRELNKGTIKNTYPLLLISELLDKLKGATVFTKLNLRNSYNNVRIKDGDQWKAAFKTNRGLFEPTVMFFGLSNSPATFQAFMNDILSNFIDEGWCVVYMDDILLFSKDQTEHRKQTERLMRRLKKHDLFLKLEKCGFDVTEVVFLGMVIRPGYIAMDPVKLAGIAEWEPPQTVKGVHAFLGFGNFYRKFIGKYAQLTRPMNDLLQKNRKFKWTKECQIAFDLLKAKFLSEPILVMPDIDKPFIIEADASKWATGTVLRQKGADGEWHPCGYLSKSLSPTEQNYEIYNRELLAIYRALMEWRHYLMGGKFKIVILSDHKNLTYFCTAQKLNRRQARWSFFLLEFDLGLVHVSGKLITQADALSRQSNEQDNVDNDNEDIVVLPDWLFIKEIDLGMKEDIVERLGPDDFHKLALEQLLQQGMPPIKSALSDWRIEGGLLFFQNWVYVLNDIDLRQCVVQVIHETPGVGHPGQWNTIEQVQRDFWWPEMARFIRSFIDSCVVCQQSKNQYSPHKDTHTTHKANTKLIPVPDLHDGSYYRPT